MQNGSMSLAEFGEAIGAKEIGEPVPLSQRAMLEQEIRSLNAQKANALAVFNQACGALAFAEMMLAKLDE